MTEKLSYEKAVRDQRLRIEIAQAKRQNNIFLQNVEKSNTQKKIEQKRKRVSFSSLKLFLLNLDFIIT